MIQIPRMILIGSANRNHGKTTLACSVIEQLKRSFPVIGLKVISIDQPNSSCQRGEEGCGLCALSHGEYELIQESNIQGSKDTSLMLQAGAQSTYLLKTLKQSVAQAMDCFLDNISKDALIVCESNTLRRFVIPGIFLFAKRDDLHKMKSSALSVIDFVDCVIDPYQTMDLSPIHVRKDNNEMIACWNMDGEKGTELC